MGSGSYSTINRKIRADAFAYNTKSVYETFNKRELQLAMSPKNIKIRESKDSKEHPNSIAIVLGLDITGSMHSIPSQLIKNGLPRLMGNIIQSGVKDPQLLFLGIGDHECDRAPLQVGQFESNDELLDKWLTDIYLEGGGGGNDGESYLLAWYFATYKTSIDCFEKRKQKGFLFTIGDEKTLMSIPKKSILNIMGNGQYQDYSAMELLDKAKEKYNVYHLHVTEGQNGKCEYIINNWKQIMGDNLIMIDNIDNISKIISEIVTKKCNIKETKNIEEKESVKEKEENIKEDILL